MKKVNTIFFIVALLTFGNVCYSQNVNPPYEVGTWQGFRTAAITFTFDDGSPNQYAIAIPMFNEFGFKLTLFIVTSPSWGWPANWTVLQNAASQGHEIASHTVTHTSLGGLSDEQQTTELKDSQDEINAHITGQRCITIAYPYCVVGNRSLCAQYYIAARICSGVIEPRTPADFMGISSIICGTEGSVKTTQDFINRANSGVNSKGWCVLLLHGIDNDGGWSSVTSSVLRADLEYLKANQDKFWVSTFANVARYIKERNAASVTELSNQDSSITLQVTDNLPDSIYNYPITLRRPMPADWQAARISQNNQTVEAQIVEINSTKYMMFDVVPGAGEIVISRSTPSSIQHRGSLMPAVPALAQNYPNPFNPSTVISYQLAVTSHVTLKVYDVLGREVAMLVNEVKHPGVYHATFSISNLPAGNKDSQFSNGVYIYRFQAGDFSQSKKMILMK